MAHDGLGHRDQAERWLASLVAAQPKEGFEMSRDDIEIRILRREAESLILGSRPAASPTFSSSPTKNVTHHPGVKPE